MKKIYTVLLSVFALSAFAQPTITSSWVPTTGLQYREASLNATTISQGSAGTAVTWDFSSIDTISTTTFQYIHPATAPMSSLFPTATDCAVTTDGSDYQYDRWTGTAYQIIGSVQPLSQGSSGYNIFTDPLDLFHLPATYNNTFTDLASYKSVQGGNFIDTFIGVETVNVTADGYGTLITKYGTFSNVLRFHIATSERDSDFLSHQIDLFSSDTYIWLSPTIPGIYLASVSHNTYQGVTQDGGSVAQIISTGVESLSDAGISSWSVVPQPITDKATIHIQNNGTDKSCSIQIHDMMGRLIMESEESIINGSNEIPLSVTSLSSGMYTATIRTQGISDTKKLMVRH